MYIKHLKKMKFRIISNLILSKIILVMIFSTGYFLYKEDQSLKKELRNSKQNLVEVNQELNYKNKEYHYMQSVRDIYNSLSMDSYSYKGIKFEKLVNFISKLKILYEVSNLNLKILKKPYETDIIIYGNKVISVQIMLEFNSYNDESSYRFLDSLVYKFPGFIKVINFNIISNDINENLIGNNNIYEIERLVTTQIIFNWYEFYDIENK